ncbi:MAG: helix-turn-helix transcriptional regulator [Deltaproteobacteria bacterium]|nr:helix-turn-helix transcriptional regulator [Deltaproteobacteria bacterium]
MVVRFAGDGPLIRAIPERYSTALHLAGRSEWSSTQGRWSSAPGMVSLKVPGEVYAERAREGRSEFQVVLFDAALVDEARAALDRPAVAPEAHAIDGRDPRARPIAALHRQLLRDRRDPAALDDAVCAALAAFVDLTCPPRGARPPITASAAVARARALLDERLTEIVTLGALAAHARLDKFHLSRAFRDQIGLPPHAYVTHRRVARAQALLVRGVPQAEVAAAVGFYDQSQLHRHFKRILGVPPGAFARAAR